MAAKAKAAEPKPKPEPRVLQVPEKATGEGRLRALGGSKSDEWNNTLANQAMNALWLGNSDHDGKGALFSAACAGLMGIDPKDELEGMMAAQLIAAHSASMECYRRAMIPSQTHEGRTENLSQANKLSRTYVTLQEALNRHRGKGGQQKVTVKHVHVHDGGQAVVGNVEVPAGGGGGAFSGKRNQAHAKAIAHAPVAPMWGEDEEREALPIGRDAER